MTARLRRLAATVACTAALAAPAAGEAPRLDGFAVGTSDGQLVVTFPVVSELTYLTLEDPPRIVLDVLATSALPGAPGVHTIRVNRWSVSGIRTSQFDPGPARPVTRIVLDMDPATFPPAGEGPLVGISKQPGFMRALVRGRNTGDAVPLVVGQVAPDLVSQAFGIPDDRSPDTPTRGLTLPANADSAIAAVSAARNAIAYDMRIPRPDVSVDPTPDIVDERQARLWDRRAQELVAKARLRLVAGDYRAGLADILKILRYYPRSRHVYEARAVAADLYAELRFDHEALSQIEQLLSSPGTPDSLVTRAIETAITCPVRPVVWRLMERVYDHAEARVGDTPAVRRLGGKSGVLMAERGEKIDEAIARIRRALEDDPEAPWAAELHEGFARCHESKGEPDLAARQHFFAAQLLRAEDPERSTSLRLRAADAYFEADDLPRAAEQYEIVSELRTAPAELRAWALFQLGNCHFRTRAFVNAAATYRRLTGDFASSFWADQAASRLAVLDRSGVVP